MAAILFDASVYIATLRSGDPTVLATRQFLTDLDERVTVWLSAVVLEELYAGIARSSDARVVSRLERDFDKANRLLAPNRTDWTNAGRTLAKLATKYGYEHIGRSRLTNDALIATSAGRQGITVVTRNTRDFHRLSAFVPFKYRAVL